MQEISIVDPEVERLKNDVSEMQKRLDSLSELVEKFSDQAKVDSESEQLQDDRFGEDIDDRVSELEDNSFTQSGGTSKTKVVTKEEPRPFHIFFDTEDEKYYIFAPKGCVLVGGKAAVAKEGVRSDWEDTQNLEIEGVGDSGLTDVYCHVQVKEEDEPENDSNSNDEPKKISQIVFWFDLKDSIDPEQGEETATGYTFLVSKVGASENDGNNYDVCTSAINIGGTGGGGILAGGCYDIDENGDFINRYIYTGYAIFDGPIGNVGNFAGQYVAVVMDSGGSKTLQGFSSISDLNDEFAKADRLVFPLYLIDSDGKPQADLRYIPRADAWGV